MSDGDIVIALSLGEEAVNLSALGVAAADVVGQAIVRGVTTAKGLGGVPGLG
jgi:L-aminopeptidase/D-esterase-like protein